MGNGTGPGWMCVVCDVSLVWNPGVCEKKRKTWIKTCPRPQNKREIAFCGATSLGIRRRKSRLKLRGICWRGPWGAALGCKRPDAVAQARKRRYCVSLRARPPPSCRPTGYNAVNALIKWRLRCYRKKTKRCLGGGRRPIGPIDNPWPLEL